MKSLAWTPGGALRTLAFLLLGASALLHGAAQAQSVKLAGMLGNKALLIVDGGAPKTVAPGETHQGVKVVSTAGDQAVVELSGKRHALRVGEAPVSSGAGGGAGTQSGQGNKIVLMAGSNGHFMTSGQINGKTTQFLVDTGASVISMSAADADRMGVDYKAGRTVQLSTANGTTVGWQVNLGSVRVGDVEVFNVPAVVASRDMPFVLLGNSFLTRFQMNRTNEEMVLTRRF
ncbi:TIGR02281 family clan AA aspartic protease [Polaromonas sp. YR568]|uniref:retropepsin-like aspartic protease family protein n=1 Tax=Polaromonas sp. YR568 TaxID=1855301 RepID=UPI00398BDB08